MVEQTSLAAVKILNRFNDRNCQNVNASSFSREMYVHLECEETILATVVDRERKREKRNKDEGAKEK